VDDHKDTLRAMSTLLRKLNHRVTAASTVNDALAAAAEGTFDVVISDIGLPDGTGLDLMRQLLERAPVAGIALTGYGMQEDVQMTREAGFASHLTKPVSFQDLQAALDKVGA
jgi:CheY-like chemotaxis protein